MKKATLFLLAIITLTLCSKDKKAQKLQTVEITLYSGADTTLFTYTLPDGTTEQVYQYKVGEFTTSHKYELGKTIKLTAEVLSDEAIAPKLNLKADIGNHTNLHYITTLCSEFAYKLECEGVVSID
jgi:hypothetical protein